MEGAEKDEGADEMMSGVGDATVSGQGGGAQGVRTSQKRNYHFLSLQLHVDPTPPLFLPVGLTSFLPSLLFSFSLFLSLFLSLSRIRLATVCLSVCLSVWNEMKFCSNWLCLFNSSLGLDAEAGENSYINATLSLRHSRSSY